MGSSVRYCNVTITTYSIGGFHGLARMFFMGSHLSSMDEPMNSLVGEKLQAHIEVKRETNRHNGQPHLFTAFSNPGELPLYPTRSHLLWPQLYLLIIYKVFVFTKNTAIDSKMSKIFNAASESCAFLSK